MCLSGCVFVFGCVSVSRGVLAQLNASIGSSQERGVWILVEAVCQHQPEAIDTQRLCANWSACSPHDNRALLSIPSVSLCSLSVLASLWCVSRNDLSDSEELSDDCQQQYLHTATMLLPPRPAGCLPPSATSAFWCQVCVRVLSCIAHTATRLPLKRLVEVATQLNTRLCDLHTPLSPQLVKGHIHTLAALTTAATKHTTTAQRIYLPQWDNELLTVCSHRLEQSVLGGQVVWSGEKEAVVVRCLFSVGELVVRGTVKPSASVVSCVQSLTAASLSTPNQPATPLSNAVRAHAFICLGKLCLKDQPLAKRSLPLLLTTLTTTTTTTTTPTPLPIRNNLLLVLADLCRTHTALVDPHMGALLACLGDRGCALLRRHALLVVCQLVQEDYVKLRVGVLLPLLVTLADEDESVAAVARSSLTHLMQQHGGKLQHCFLDVIYYLNGGASATGAVGSSESFAAAGLSLSSYSRRAIVYDSLCCQLSDESKLLTASKLCQDVLAAVVDGSLPLNERTSPVVHDTLTILASDNMKLHSTTNKASNTGNDDDHNDNNDDDTPSTQSQPAQQQHVAESLKQAKSRLLSKLSKRSILEQVLPVLMELKRKLETARSPLVRAVLEWMRCLYVEWRSDVVAVLAADRQLAVEMEYDMRRMEDERKEKQKNRHSGQRKLDSSATTSRSKRKPQQATAAPPAASRLSLSNVAASLPAPSPVRAARSSLSAASPSPAKQTEAVVAVKGRVSLPGGAGGGGGGVGGVAFATPAKVGGRGGGGGGVVATPASAAVFQSPRLLRGHSTPASTTAATHSTKRLSMRAVAAPVSLFAEANSKASRASTSPLADKENEAAAAAAALTVNFSPSLVDGASAATWKLDKLTLSSANKVRPPAQAQAVEDEGLEDDEQPGSRQQQPATSGMSLRKRRISASAELQQVKQEMDVVEAANEKPEAKAQFVKRTRTRSRNSTGTGV